MNVLRKLVAWPTAYFIFYTGALLTKILWGTRWHTFDQWHWLMDLAMVIQDWGGLDGPWQRTSPVKISNPDSWPF